ncbi:hypothetical protein [Microbacterium galbinum]|uniref:hypothetical protein n=1 Tax=Microbacterium galbinum TaxID=2851646 RepID=UPI001FFD4E60|nr:hypothetical protein [Microbacterium galbinum]MCK2029885.1 hypothetical protein [Microbacterium galbinum]
MSADWVMVWVTGASVIVTGVLAWLAYANGREATKIAAEASMRDEVHRGREVGQREQEGRARVALAMMRGVAAAERFAQLQKQPGGIHTNVFTEVETEMHFRWSEAVAHVDLYSVAVEDEELRVWIESALDAVAYPGAPQNNHLDWGHAHFVRRGIRLWNLRAVTSGQLAVGNLPPEHEEGDEASVILA